MDAASSPVPLRPALRRIGRPVFRVRSLPDLLSLVPVVLGFEPHESLVVAGIAGARPGFHVRVDLPPSGRDDLVGELGVRLAAALGAQGCTRVAVLGFSGEVSAERTLREVADALEEAGIEVVDVVRSDGGRYWSLVCGNPDCCPPDGVAYDPSSSQVRAEATLAGIAVAPDRAALAARLGPCSGEQETRMRAATRSAEREVVSALGLRGRRALRCPPASAVRAARAVGVARVDRLLDRLLDGRSAGPEALSDADAAALSVWCSMIRLRDLAWSRIDRSRASEHLALWSAVARRVVPPYEPAVLSLAGFAAWASGDGASAWCAVDRALAADPGYSMAQLLGDTLARCVPPDVWVPPPRDVILASFGRDIADRTGQDWTDE